MTKTKSETKPASWWAKRSETPKNIDMLFKAVDAERLARIEAWDKSHYMVFLVMWEHNMMGFSSFVKHWQLAAPGAQIQNHIDHVSVDAYRLGGSMGHREPNPCPVFQTEEMAQDFACSLDLGRQQRIRITTDAEKFYTPQVLSDVGLIDKWLDDCFQKLRGEF